MKNKVKVTAQAFDPNSGEPLAVARDEVIDLTTNELFSNCFTLTDVSERYQVFWNRLPSTQREMVLVQAISWVK